MKEHVQTRPQGRSGKTDERFVRPEDVWDGRALRANVFLMDVRTPAEFRGVHIPGSRNVPLDRVKEHLSDVLDRAADARVAIVCHSWTRSRVVQDELERLGIQGIAILRGGITAWIEAGLPVVRDEAGGRSAISIERQVQLVSGSLVLLGLVLGAFVSPWFALLSGLVGVGLVYAGATGTCRLALLLAKLRFNRPT